jgi:hypothetical protein
MNRGSRDFNRPIAAPREVAPEVTMFTYARFSNYAAAREASNLIQQEIGNSGRVRVLRNAQRLSHHIIPLCMTAVRFGAVFGGAMVAALTLVASGAFLWVLGALGEPVPVPAATLALCVGLSALFGCLAGALCFATDTNIKVEAMREWIGGGKPVVLIESRHDHEQTMRFLGAETVGKIG